MAAVSSITQKGLYWLTKGMTKTRSDDTVFENHRKSLIQHCERSELRLHLEWTKVN